MGKNIRNNKYSVLYRQPITILFLFQFLFISAIIIFQLYNLVNTPYFIIYHLLALIIFIPSYFLLPSFRILENSSTIFIIGNVYPIIGYKIFKKGIEGVYHVQSSDDIYKYSMVDEIVRIHPKWLSKLNGMRDEVAIFMADKVIIFNVRDGREVVEKIRDSIGRIPEKPFVK
jgi:hypothetical protein